MEIQSHRFRVSTYLHKPEKKNYTGTLLAQSSIHLMLILLTTPQNILTSNSIQDYFKPDSSLKCYRVISGVTSA